MTEHLVTLRLADCPQLHPLLDLSHRCACCAAPVALYPSGQILLRRYPDLAIVCSVCGPPAERRPCPTCRGSGYVYARARDTGPGDIHPALLPYLTTLIPCPDCTAPAETVE